MKPKEPAVPKVSHRSIPIWLVTYADLVTLLLAFFVLLYSFSTVDFERFQSLKAGLRQSFGPGISEGEIVLPNETPFDLGIDLAIARERRELEQMQRLYRDFSDFIADNGLDSTVSIEYEDRGLVVRFLDSLFFDTGRAELKDNSRQVLQQAAALLLPIPNQIRVEGHTDDRPIQTGKFPSNWELSTARATVVLRYLVEELQFPPQRISATGYGEYRPIADNGTAAGRRQNRRVDVVILRPSFQTAEPGTTGRDSD